MATERQAESALKSAAFKGCRDSLTRDTRVQEIEVRRSGRGYAVCVMVNSPDDIAALRNAVPADIAVPGQAQNANVPVIVLYEGRRDHRAMGTTPSGP